jgi:two-component system response regulator YesN
VLEYFHNSGQATIHKLKGGILLMCMYSILIVDDEYLVRLGIKETINWEDYSIKVIGDADNGRDGLDMAMKLKPDIIITDVRMPVLDGLELLKAIKSANLDSIVIILSGYEEFDYVRAALHSGAFAYLLKPIDNSELINTILNGVKEIEKRRSSKQHFSLLKEELSSVRKHFLNDFLTGKINDASKIKEKLQLYNINISKEKNYILYLTINSYKELLEASNVDKFNTAKDTLNSLLSDLLNTEHFQGIYTNLSEGEWIIIISTGKADNSLKLIKSSIRKTMDDFKQSTDLTCSAAISSVCNELSEISRSYAEVRRTVSLNMFTNINRILSSEGIDGTLNSRKINEAIKYITSNYNKDISVESAANALYISSSYLMHLFKDNLGKTFNECLTEIRINAAKELLSDVKYKVYEVCTMVGYNDIKYFSQIFKRVTGMTPSHYSKNIQHRD